MQKRPKEDSSLLSMSGAIAEKNQEEKNVVKDSKATWGGGAKKLKFSYNEQKEYETIEEDIEALETRIAEIEKEILKNSRDFVKLNELSKEKEEREEALMLKMERWEYLEELAAKIAAQ